eukprot:8164-Heterococcus_DN1.PRE.21
MSGTLTAPHMMTTSDSASSAYEASTASSNSSSSSGSNSSSSSRDTGYTRLLALMSYTVKGDEGVNTTDSVRQLAFAQR